MGGFAVAIDWDRPIAAGQVESMLALIPHRATLGTATVEFGSAALGETRTNDEEPSATPTTNGRFTIVGDLRIWSLDALRVRAGGSASTRGMGDRELILRAYARSGLDFLNALDGDFAFVIWDEQRRRAVAVRDRFGAKTLFFERTPAGIRFATEVKQLAATSTNRVAACDESVFGYLNGQPSARHTFFQGISRVLPAQYMVAEPGRVIEHGYWNPSFEPGTEQRRDEVVAAFRESLVSSVEKRISTSDGVVAHLSGGLDSSSIVAAASLIATRHGSTPPFTTVSALFPNTDTDESLWISETVEATPFRHESFVPPPEAVEQYAEVMWQTDSPLHNRIRGIWPGTAEIAHSVGADLVLMGSGGDEVLDQSQLLADLLRTGSLGSWLRAARAEARWRGWPTVAPLKKSVRRAIPGAVKQPIRRHIGDRLAPRGVLARTGTSLARHLTGSPQQDTTIDAPSHSQRLAVASTRSPRRVSINESQEAVFAYHGVSASYPLLDRSVVECVSSIPPSEWPFDGSTKSLARQAFAGVLPASVVERRTKTLATSYHDIVFGRLARDYRLRYPEVSEAALGYIDPARYRSALQRLDGGRTDHQSQSAIWDAWTLMLWLDGLERYANKPGWS